MKLRGPFKSDTTRLILRYLSNVQYDECHIESHVIKPFIMKRIGSDFPHPLFASRTFIYEFLDAIQYQSART